MNFKNLLPIGSIVLLKDAQKKIMIIGTMPIKHIDTGEDIAYDYMGIPYPEGYIGPESGLLFNHVSIQETVFIGYSDEERDFFVNAIQNVVEKVQETITKSNLITEE